MNTISRVYDGVSKSFRTETIEKYTLTTINTRWEATQGIITAKLTTLTHKIAIQLHLVTFAVLAPGRQFENFWIHTRKFGITFNSNPSWYSLTFQVVYCKAMAIWHLFVSDLSDRKYIRKMLRTQLMFEHILISLTQFHWYHVRWVSCHYGMARLQVADGGYLRIYWISSNGQSTRGGPPAWGLGVRLQSLTVKSNLLRNVSKRFGPELILRHDLSNGKRT